jgi:PAS domain S-box-containing protein
MALVTTEIEDRRRAAEDPLEMREDQFLAVADAIPALIALMTPAGEVASINCHTREYLGATLEEMKGWARGHTVHPDDLPAVVAAWKRSVDTEEPYDVEHRIRRADGVYRWFHVRGLPIRDANGRVASWCVIQTDVDDRKRGEILLAEEKRFLEMAAGGRPMSSVLTALCHLVEGAESGCYCSVLLVDPSGARFERGAAPSLPERFIASIVGLPVTLESGPCGMAACLDEQVIAPDLTLETQWAANEWYSMALSYGLRACWSTPIPSSAGRVLGTFAIHYDEPRSPTPLHHSLIEQFTHIASIAVERARGEEALSRARSELAHMTRVTTLGALAASIAHEVSQPLSGIVTNSSTCLRMLGAEPPNVEGAKETVRRTIRDGHRASEVITRLRALFGNKGSVDEPVDLNDAAREVIALSWNELQRSRIVPRTELAADLPPVRGDRVQLQQVILNLILNAADAMSGVEDHARQLVVRTEVEEGGEQVRLSVQDAGVGLEVENVERLFEAFYTTKSDGMGMGLSVSRSIIEGHHGRLRAEPNEGPGATFSFSIPATPGAS